VQQRPLKRVSAYFHGGGCMNRVGAFHSSF